MTLEAHLAGVVVGDDASVVVMGALNASPESFYRGSVATGADHLLRAAEAMVTAGASMIDVGAMSTAPYLATRISETEESDRLGWAIGHLAGKLDVPISADTSRAAPARAALQAGARIINDVTGLTGACGVADAVAQSGAGLILMASECPETPAGDPVEVVAHLLTASVGRALAAGVRRDVIAVDPGIGFFRNGGIAWHVWDCAVLARLPALRAVGYPLCIGVSRKSFIGAVSGESDPGRRLPGSLAATAVAVLGGAHLIRTHDVAETVQAVRVAEAVRRAAASTTPPVRRALE